MSPAAIIEAVAKRHDLRPWRLRNPDRCPRVSHPRQEVAWLLRKVSRMSLPDIAKVLGQNHTTILHSLRAVEARLSAVELFALQQEAGGVEPHYVSLRLETGL